MSIPNRNSTSNAIIFIAACAICTGSAAHTGAENPAQVGFLTGFMHPLLGLDHLAVMVSVGVWSAVAARRAGAELLWGPVGFATLLLAGALAGLQGIPVLGVEPMIATSLLVTGLLVVTRWRVTGLVAALLVGVFAVFHGLAHGYELADRAGAIRTLAGILVATVLLHAAGLGLGWILRSRGVWLSRAAGAAVAAFGSGLLLQMA